MAYAQTQAQARLRAGLPARELALGPVSLATLTILIGFVLSLFYLSQSSRIATRGYQIIQLEQSAQDLKSQNNELQVQAARLQSIQAVKARVEASGGMVPTTQTSYLEGK